ncbi:M14 family zinc carboxypeptidase [Nocardioides sp. MAHUQ-72]|uniref:M14 family zinc carboxypeptidase n=1 Tax=unclassified Nocardioides TaxID=2615069 RepID=UPI003613EA42
MLRRLGTTAAALALLVAGTPGPPASARLPESDGGAVIGKRLLGTSVEGRRIRAWHLGEPGRPKVVLIASMHGNETAPRKILQVLRDGKQINGIDLWVVPTYNPDGAAAGTRKNAHGVDLNRNYPYRWADLDGNYESGSKPASEPETRAMMKFLRDVKPDWILSFHQPLHGVDTDTKRPRFARKVGRHLDLPAKEFTCGGVCHGTMTMWFNHRFTGTALTVEYGDAPPRRLMRVKAPRQVLSIWGAWRGQFGFGHVG